MNETLDEFEMDDVERMLERLSNDAMSHINTCEYKTSFDKNAELRMRAKQEGRVQYYVDGTFFQMDQAQYLLEYNTMRERAIELISLLSDHEQLLKIESDIPVDFFEYAVFAMRPCGYENLAEATGSMEGYNSDGLHDCISDGLQVCRSVGKMGCINCFREYACDVYLAADDFELAQHQCQTVVNHEGEWQARGNRRWLGQNKLAWMDTLRGDLAEAKNGFEKALYYTQEPDVSLKLESRFKVLVELDAVLIARGEEPRLPKDEIFAQLPADNECVLFDMKRAWNRALQAAVAKDYAAAEKILSQWDRTLRSKKATHFWFENRLRQIACKRLTGDIAGAENLAETVEERAKEANDWLTIRRLNDIVGGSNDPSPLGVSLATKSTAGSVSATIPQDAENKKPERNDPEISPECKEHLDTLSERLREAMQSNDGDSAVSQILSVVDELTTVTTEQCQNWTDSACYLNMMLSISRIYVGDRTMVIWKWANKIASEHQKNGYIISLLAAVGHYISRAAEDPENCSITEDRLRQLFKRSLQLVTDGPGTYFRAGEFFESVGDVGESERCYARSFKLARADGDVATKLASLYNDTERPRDALHVLDLCLREGTDYPLVAYHAARTALDLEQYEPMMTYLDRFLEFDDIEMNSPVPYLQAVGHLHIGNSEQALESIELESTLSEGQFHCDVVRACAASEFGDAQTAAEFFEKAVRVPLSQLDYLPPRDVAYLLRLLLKFKAGVSTSTELRTTLENRLLAIGEMPNEYFDAQREQRPTGEELMFYFVLISQPLDESWGQSENCLPVSAEWDHYMAEWGALAENEEQAAEYVLELQSRCYADVPAIVLEVREESGPYNDSPGVTFQGMRRVIPLAYMQSDDEDDSPTEQ